MSTSEDRRPPEDVWDALARGELTPEELATLRALAEEDEEIRARLELFAPLGAAFEETVAASIVAAASPPARRSAARARWTVALGGAVAIAAAVMLVVVSRPAPGGEIASGWSVTLAAGAREERGGGEEAQAVARFLPETRVELTLAPPASVDRAMEVAAFLVRAGAPGEVRDWSPPIERAPSGAMRVRGRAGELFAGVPPGRWTVAVVIGATLPERETMRAWARGRDPRVHVVELELLEGAP